MPAPTPRFPFRSRPMLLLAALFAAGIGLATLLPAVPLLLWAVLVLIAAGAGLLVGTRPSRRLVTLHRLQATAAVALAVMGAGAARQAAWHEPAPNDVSRLAGGTAEVQLFGRIDGAPRVSSTGQQLRVAADSLLLQGRLLHVSGTVDVRLRPSRFQRGAAPFSTLEAGTALALTAALQPLPLQRNPSDFDYGAYLARQGIGATMGIYKTEHVEVLAAPAGFVQRGINAAQRHVRHALATHVRADEPRAVLQALLLADRGGLGEELRGAFARTGLMHLLAVSGLHVLLVGMGLFALLKPLLGRLGFGWQRTEILRAAATLLLLAAYVTLCGAPVSAVRALVMGGLALGAHLLHRSVDPLNTLGLAGLLLLALRPAALFDVGFQLSFSAVGALILLSPALTDMPFWEKVPKRLTSHPAARWLGSMTVATVAATLGTAPVMLYHFGQVPLAGLVLNLPAIPATMAALGGALGTVLFSGWAPVLAEVYGAAAGLAAELLVAVSRHGAEQLGFATIERFVRSPLWVLAGIGLLVALALAHRPRARSRAAGASLACGTLAVWLGLLAPAPGLDVLFFDVGQGDAALLTFPDGRTLLVDAGIADDYRDAGARTILPHLQRHGIRRIDAVVLTHPHADHYGGLFSLLQHVDIGRVLHNGHAPGTPLYDSLLAALDARGIPHGAKASGDTLHVSPTARIDVLQGGAESDDANDGSVVLQLRYGQTRLLLTGDAEESAERLLVRRYGHRLRSDVVKVAHHGSRTSSTPAFVDAASDPSRPPLAVMSVAAHNGYGLPDEEPLALWKSVGAELVTTAESGAVWLQSDGERFRRVAWR